VVDSEPIHLELGKLVRYGEPGFLVLSAALVVTIYFFTSVEPLIFEFTSYFARLLSSSSTSAGITEVPLLLFFFKLFELITIREVIERGQRKFGLGHGKRGRREK